MAVRVGDTLKPMNDQDFPVVEAADVSGLSSVATTGSYSSLSGKPTSVGSTSLPAYFDSNGTAQEIEELALTGAISTTSTIRAESDFFTRYVTGVGSGEVWITLDDDDDNHIISTNSATEFRVNGPTVLGRTNTSSDTVTINNDITINSENITAVGANMEVYSVKPEIIFSSDGSYCRTEYHGFPFYTDDDIFTVKIDPNSTTTVMPNSSSSDKLTVNGNIITSGIQIGGAPAMGSSTGELVLAVKGWSCFDGSVSGKDCNISGDNSSFYLAPDRYTTIGQKTLGTTSSTVGAYTTTSHTMLQCWGNAHIGKSGERHVLAVYGDIGAYNVNQTNTVSILGHGTSNGGNIYVRSSNGTSTVSITGNTGTVSATTVSATSVNATNLSGVLNSLYSGGVGGIFLIRLDYGAKPSSDITWAKGSELHYNSSTSKWVLGSYNFNAAAICYQQYGSAGLDFSSTGGSVGTGYKFYAITPLRLPTAQQYALGYFLRYA